jgi:hypothetical protein
MWLRIAKAFQIESLDPVPTALATYKTHKSPLWAEIVRKYRLQPIPYEQLVSWSFGDFILNSGFDNISSTIKTRRAGFADCIDTKTCFSASSNNFARPASFLD